MSLASELREVNRHQWSAVAASFLGWTLDAFDFFLMVFMFKAIAHDFGTDVKAVAVALTLTLAARPFGAFVFGLFADRFGRRPVLMADVMFYSLVEFASAFAPSLAVLLILRALFGFAMGGEWGIGASLVMETVPAKLRGLVSGLLQEGYAVGYLLAALVFGLFFDRVGWRGMFMIGVLPALLAVFIRMGVKESPAFEAQRVAAPKRGLAFLTLVAMVALAAALAPVLAGSFSKEALWRWVYLVDAPIGLAALFIFRKHWRLALYVIVLMTAFNFFSHGTQDLYPTFLQVQHGLGTHTTSLITVVMNCGAVTGGLFFGALSEKIGRKRAIVIAVLLALPVLWLWAFAATPVLLGLGAFLMQLSVQGAWGVVPAHLNELSPPNMRGVFPGYAYQLGNLLASGNAVLQAGLAEQRHNNYGFALAVVAGVGAVAIALLTAFGPERRGADFTLQGEEGPQKR
jgi:SHS family lactate transporter-like MFS transporter